MLQVRLACYIATSLSIVSASVLKAENFDALLKRVPAGANTLVLIDVDATLATPVAREKGWGKKLEIGNVQRPIFLPPEASKLVIAASLRTANDFSRQWELAAIELGETLSMRSIARSEGGYVDSIKDVPVAWTPSDAYFVSFGDQELGILHPAERQFVSRWIEYAKTNSEVAISEYLKKASTLANEKVPMLMAIDLRDVVSPHEIDAKLRESQLIEQAGISITDASDLLLSLQGAMLRIAVGQKVQGQLRIDFAKPIEPLKPIAKDLVINTLNQLGAPIDDLSHWKLELEEKSITMRGPLSEDGQRRMFSIVEIPSTKFSTLKDADPESRGDSQETDSRVVEASLTYYRAIEVLLRDLRRDMRGSNAPTAVMERYARKIDRMPILHVDDELLDYGSQMAESLRGVALARRGGAIEAGTQTAGMGRGRGVDTSYKAYGYTMPGDQLYAARESAADRASIKANAMAGYRNTRAESAKDIADRSASIRRRMTEKYGVEF